MSVAEAFASVPPERARQQTAAAADEWWALWPRTPTTAASAGKPALTARFAAADSVSNRVATLATVVGAG